MSLFCERFRELKKDSGLKLKELSEELNITIPNLSYYMTGREPNYDVLIKIANHFNVSIDWLLGHSDEIECKSHCQIVFNLYDEMQILKEENEKLKEKLNTILEIASK